MIRIAIAEDDPQCAQQLKQYISDFGRETGRTFQIDHYENGEDLLEHYKPEFDLILMDVEMPFIDGMTAARHIRQLDPEVILIFITNLAQYAIQGYEVNALDYILKPVSYFSFTQRLNRALRYVHKHENSYLTIAVKGGAVKLDIDSIYYIERQKDQLLFHTYTGVYTSHTTLQQVEQALADSGLFFRCNKGYLVNLAQVEGFRDGCAIVNGTPLLVSRPRKAQFISALNRYMGEVIG